MNNQTSNTEVKVVRGYKVFNNDWTCRGFKFRVGEEYTVEGEPILCKNGFHFCEMAADCFNYYKFDSNNKIASIEAVGKIHNDGGDKSCTNHIRIVEEISWEKLLTIVNTGNRNTGYRNTGDCNTGDCNTGYRNTGYRNTGDWNTGNCNTGYRNTGYRNTGDWNTGNWNTGNCNTGYFNTISPNINVFNSPCDKEIWDNCVKPSFIYFNLVEWVNEEDMSDSEKMENPSYPFVGGYLKKYEYKEAFLNSWINTTKDDRKMVRNLPNFNEEIFFEISGIRVSDYGV